MNARRWATALGVMVVALLTTRVRRLEVAGHSMEPTLLPGDRVLVVKGRRGRPGDLVAVADPREPSRLVVKRVAGVADGRVTVLGDNPASSTDSRTFGDLGHDAIAGRAVYRYFPEHRRGPLIRK